MTPESFLRSLFESDKKSPWFYRQFPPYEGDKLLGAKPWLPPLCEVWKVGESCPETYPSPDAWAEAWQLLTALHEQYLESRNE